MKGECLCRNVTIEVRSAPEYINVCNCKFCRKAGAAWGYYAPQDVAISGDTTAYQRDDLGYEPWSRGHFCPTCGSTSHFEVVHPQHEGIGVNTRLFDQDAFAGVEVRYYDSRRRTRADGLGDVEQTGTGKIGDGCAF